eukprot:1291728-Pleurochrysis_carterae.AAC.2
MARVSVHSAQRPGHAVHFRRAAAQPSRLYRQPPSRNRTSSSHESQQARHRKYADFASPCCQLDRCR